MYTSECAGTRGNSCRALRRQVGVWFGNFGHGRTDLPYPCSCQAGNLKPFHSQVGHVFDKSLFQTCPDLASLWPIVLRSSWWAFHLLSRLFEGLFEGGTYPALMSMSSHWVPEEEKATLSAFIWAGSQFGVVLAMPIAGLLAQVQSLKHLNFFLFFTFFDNVALKRQIGSFCSNVKQLRYMVSGLEP